MAHMYSIKQVISTSRGGRQQITTAFDGKVVTRHIINGVGRHPDDTVPKVHERLNHLYTEMIEIRKSLLGDIEKVEKTEAKKVRGEFKRLGLDITETSVEKARTLVLTMLRGKAVQTDASIDQLAVQLATLEENDPLQVRYV